MLQNNKKLVFYAVAFLIASFLSLVLFFTCLELYLRFKARANYDRAIHLSKDIFTKGETTGYRLIPNRRYLVRDKEFSFVIASNSHGIRDREFTPEIPEGKKRIIVFGDSFTFGHGVENNEAYPKVLERELAGYGGYEVINGGMPGTSLYDNIVIMKEALGIYKTDFVMLALHSGDLGESSNSNKGVLEEGAVTETRTTDKGEQVKRPFFIIAKDYLRRNILSYGFIVNKIRRVRFLSNILIKLHIISSCDTVCSVNDEFDDPNAIKLLQSLLEDYSDYVKKHGGIPILFYIPDRWYVAPKRFYTDATDRLHQINEILKDLSGKEGVVFIDTSAIKEYPDADSELYYDYDYHFNRKGNEVFGKILCQATLKSKCLER